MKLTPWYLAALAPIAIAGWSGALLGHAAVLAVTISIFVGTLSLGRHTAPARASLAPPALVHGLADVDADALGRISAVPVDKA